MYYEVIQKHFPSIIDKETYFGSSFRLFTKKGKRKLISRNHILPISKAISTNDEFFNEQKIKIEKILQKINLNEYVLLKCTGKMCSDSPLYFVATLERNGEVLKHGENALFYQAYDQSKLNEINTQTDFFLAFDLPNEALPSDILKIYFWNPEKKHVEIGRTKIYFEKD
jgi:hypothetical protein